MNPLKPRNWVWNDFFLSLRARLTQNYMTVKRIEKGLPDVLPIAGALFLIYKTGDN